MQLTFEKLSQFINDDQQQAYPFSMEERQLAAKSSAETWDAVLKQEIKPFDFQKAKQQ